MRTFAIAAAAVALATPVAKVQSVLLRPGDVGPGYTLHKGPGWNAVQSQVTLDLCGYDFRSEALRLAREQVAYTGAGKLPLSNEVVAYKPGGAAQALRELRSAIAHCPSGFTSSKVATVKAERNIITVIHPSGLLPGSVAFLDRITIEPANGGKAVTLTGTIVYQARKDVLSSVYTYTAGSRTLALHAARSAARRLRAL